MDLAVNEAVRLLNSKASYIKLLQHGVLVPGAATTSAVQYLDDTATVSTAALLSAGKTAAGQLIATKSSIVIDDVTQDDLIMPQTQRMAEKHGFYGIVGVPILAEDEVIGVFFVFDGNVRLFTEDDISALTGLADQAALALNNQT